jgi:DNA-nicking Smr family endonuclease
MSDFGRIFEQWESLQRRSERRSGGRLGEDTDDAARTRSWLERSIDRYPIVDKDRSADCPENGHRSPGKPEDAPVEASIDLHGCTLDEALAATRRFIDESVARGLRKVRVIHGKGRNGDGILKREVRAYLERDRRTGTMGYFSGPEGGRGALWVMLRDRRT